MRTIAVFVENRPFFGALLVHVPLLDALRRREPGARIVLYAPFPQARMLVDIGAADDVVEYSGRFAQVRALLRAARPDEALVLRPASRGLDLAVAAAGVPVTAGYASWLSRLVYTRVVPHDTGIYRPRKYLSLIMPREEALRAPLDSWFRPLAPAATRADGNVRTLAVLPVGGAGPFKRWEFTSYVELCTRLAAEDPALRFTWVLGPAEMAYERDFRRAIGSSPAAGRFEILFNRPLPELAAAAFSAHAAVGNDCGPGHVFQMCGCPFACVLSDHDLRGPRVADEWLDAANRPFATLSAPGEPIETIALEPVLERTRAALAARPALSSGAAAAG